MSIQPKYSKLENERRWLVSDEPSLRIDSSVYTLIEDKYLTCGRMRLRKMTTAKGEVTFKLCKKYGTIARGCEPITNLYLSESEYHSLLKLDGASLTKRRHRISENGYVYSLDIFIEPNEELMIAEIEADTLAELAQIPAPSFASREITADETYEGRTLAR